MDLNVHSQTLIGKKQKSIWRNISGVTRCHSSATNAREKTAYSLNKHFCKPNNLEEEATSAQHVPKTCEITIDVIQKKGYECPFDRGFQNKFYSDVRNHMKNCHKEEISLAFQCNLCKRNYISAFALLNHKYKTRLSNFTTTRSNQMWNYYKGRIRNWI